MKILQISSGLLQVNSYFLVNENTNEAIVIDAGEDYNLIVDFAKKNQIKIVAELLTHVHFDHAGNAKKLQQDGIKIYCSFLDSKKAKNRDNLASDFGLKFEDFTPDFYINGAEILDIIGIKIKVISTPGHTDGSLTFNVDNYLFTGDTLFRLSIGNTNFPTGSLFDMKNSLKKLFSLSGDYRVYAGHGESTTLEYEREHNPYKNL